MPRLAADGIGSGRAMAAVPAAGADGLRAGTRFLATEETEAYPEYLKALIIVEFQDTIYTRTITADGKVTFRYEASGTGEIRLCTLPVEEFIRRFLQHVLPKGFVKVRYYGFFSSGNRHKLRRVRQLLGARCAGLTTDQQPQGVPQEGAHPCPRCGQVMRWIKALSPVRVRPP